MRKKLIVAAVAIGGLLSMSACSTTSTASTDHKTLTVLSYYTAEPAKSAFDKFLAGCTKANPGFTFKQLGVPQANIITKATQLTASGNGPAIIIADNPNTPTLAAAGVLRKIDVAATGLKTSDFEKGPLDSGAYKGVQYGLPIGNNGEVIVYNTAALQSAGIAPPKSWADLTAAAKKLTVGGKYGFGQSFGGGEETTWTWITQLWSNGGSLTKLTDDSSIAATDFWTSFIRNGTAPKASLNWTSNDLVTQFTTGQLPIVQVGTWTLAQLQADAKKAGIDVGIAPQISPDGSAPHVPFGGEVMTVGSGATGAANAAASKCIGSFSKDPAALAKFDGLLGYVPSYIPAQSQFLDANPDLKVMAGQLANAQSRTAEVGAKYNAYSAAISTALQQIAAGTKSTKDALAAAQTAANQ